VKFYPEERLEGKEGAVAKQAEKKVEATIPKGIGSPGFLL
jgi:hypothetical protein